jgi:hypothetical protein
MLNHKKKMIARSNRSSSILLKRKFIGDEENVEGAKTSKCMVIGEVPTVRLSTSVIEDTKSSPISQLSLPIKESSSLRISSSLPPTLKEVYPSPISPLKPTTKDEISPSISPLPPGDIDENISNIKEKKALPSSPLEIKEQKSSASSPLRELSREEEIRIEIKDTSDILKKFLDATGSSPGESSDSDNEEERGKKKDPHDNKIKENNGVRVERNNGVNKYGKNKGKLLQHKSESPDTNTDMMTSGASISPVTNIDTPTIKKKHPVNKTESLKKKPGKSSNISVKPGSITVQPGSITVQPGSITVQPAIPSVVAPEPVMSTPVTRRRNNELKLAEVSLVNLSTPPPMPQRICR